MLSELELESLYQENRAKSQLIEKVNIHALELQEQITELNRQLIFVKEECSQLREEKLELQKQITELNRQFILVKEECSQLREENIRLQEKCNAQLGVKAMAKQFPRSFMKAVLWKLFRYKV